MLFIVDSDSSFHSCCEYTNGNALLSCYYIHSLRLLIFLVYFLMSCIKISYGIAFLLQQSDKSTLSDQGLSVLHF